MKEFMRVGRVIWYDAARGYGFVKENNASASIFITKSVLDEFGVTGLKHGSEIYFDVIEGQASARVNSIKKLSGEAYLH